VVADRRRRIRDRSCPPHSTNNISPTSRITLREAGVPVTALLNQPRVEEMATVVTSYDTRAVARYYHCGMSIRHAGAFAGCSYGTAHRLLVLAGVKLRPRGAKNVVSRLGRRGLTVAIYLAAGIPTSEIAKWMNLTVHETARYERDLLTRLEALTPAHAVTLAYPDLPQPAFDGPPPPVGICQGG
jgi:hypothetical protein